MPCSTAFEHSELSAAERRVLQQLERGYSNKAIAAALILSRLDIWLSTVRLLIVQSKTVADFCRGSRSPSRRFTSDGG